jgi:hypothetical protein
MARARVEFKLSFEFNLSCATLLVIHRSKLVFKSEVHKKEEKRRKKKKTARTAVKISISVKEEV